MSLREFVSRKELEAYAVRMGKVAVSLEIMNLQRRLSPDEYELVHLHTPQGVRRTLLVTNAALKALWEAEAPFWGIETLNARQVPEDR